MMNDTKLYFIFFKKSIKKEFKMFFKFLKRKCKNYIKYLISFRKSKSLKLIIWRQKKINSGIFVK